MRTRSPSPAIYKDTDPDDLMIPRREEERTASQVKEQSATEIMLASYHLIYLLIYL